ncbi:zinc metallopeptidase [Halorhodospira halophila]|uniref:Peptidase, membrane zinc metallopeptidase, putative n=1 Tax=Halorhodospira halophila (strain DSM 244 / SL1) TaxID=349124 RepID=A1WTF7_HALHL|nr:zinc metallopeptidase [Halorhodospira halophila]ABM60969.1 peptidase, membrane zinc metallopeptidase, putative [Halorhodospira halophila SL1]MBK1728627.1 peptidase [Halorhodospira halophila]
MIWILLLVLLLGAVYGPGLWVQRVMRRYAEPGNRYPVTGGQLARELLDGCGLNRIRVERTERGDHYDPQAGAVRLSAEHYDRRSLAALTVAAHEVGHALQHTAGYGPFVWRQRLVRAVGRAQQLGAVLLLAAPVVAGVLRVPGVAALFLLGGVLSLGSGVVVHLVTLPTELDASFRRALPLLRRSGYLYPDVDPPHARRILSAAALTYVAQSLASLLNFWTWLRVLRPGP